MNLKVNVMQVTIVQRVLSLRQIQYVQKAAIVQLGPLHLLNVQLVNIRIRRARAAASHVQLATIVLKEAKAKLIVQSEHIALPVALSLNFAFKGP